jgi:hypothetical protein
MINRLKKFFEPKPRVTHKILHCDTRILSPMAPRKLAIFIEADLYSASGLDALIDDLVEKFKVHRMGCPPEISLLLITIIGECDGSDVAARWRKRVAGDKIASVWMDRMEKADVGVKSSSPMSTVYHSLLPEGGNESARMPPGGWELG